MGKYYIEATTYEKYANIIQEHLQDVLKDANEIVALLDGSNAQFDYVTRKVIAGNNEIKTKVSKIQEQLKSISSQLKAAGKTIDERIEAEMREAKAAEIRKAEKYIPKIEDEIVEESIDNDNKTSVTSILDTTNKRARDAKKAEQYIPNI